MERTMLALESARRMLGGSVWALIAIVLLSALCGWGLGFLNSEEVFAFGAWLPVVSMFAVLSLQGDFLIEILRRKRIDIMARVYDGVHWLLYVAVTVGAFMFGGITPWWFFLNLLVLALIGAAIGAGLKGPRAPTRSQLRAAVIVAMGAVAAGILVAYARYFDDSYLGWGWIAEISASVAATSLVAVFMLLDLRVMAKKAKGYPRHALLKGIAGNLLLVWAWVYVMEVGRWEPEWQWEKLGLTFNIFIGNFIYDVVYYGGFEYHRWKQRKTT